MFRIVSTLYLALLYAPERIFNCDETWFQLDRSSAKVVVSKGTKHAYTEQRGSSADHITVLECGNAAGRMLPPMIIHQHCCPEGKFWDEGPTGAVYASTESGYVDSQIFQQWIDDVFLAQVKFLEKPVMLILDGHGSHIKRKVGLHLVAAGVILFVLPPHTTHLLQPLDVALFKYVKGQLDKVANKIRLATMAIGIGALQLNKSNFHKIYKAVHESIAPATVINGFRKCGIHPFDPTAIKEDQLVPERSVEQSEHLPVSHLVMPVNPVIDCQPGMPVILPMVELTEVPAGPEPAPEPAQAEPGSRDGTLPVADDRVATAVSLRQVREASTTADLCHPQRHPSIVDPVITPTAATQVTTTSSRYTPSERLLSSLPPHVVKSMIMPQLRPEKKKSSTRVCTKARVMTAPAMLAELEEKERLKEEKAASVAARKEQRDLKRQQKVIFRTNY